MFLKCTSFLFLFGFCYGSSLWSRGVVHYTIDAKDYDDHSQDVITSTLAKIEKEICVKFFSIPANYSMGDKDRTLLISNPQNLKSCFSYKYDFSKHVVLMPIGYKCLNEKEIATAVVDMLRASIQQSNAIVNSYDLLKKFKEIKEHPYPAAPTSILPPNDRDYINANYNAECHKLSARPGLAVGLRRNNDETDEEIFSKENVKFFSKKQWPLGIVMYDTGFNWPPHPAIAEIKQAMGIIESQTCVVFHALGPSSHADSIQPKNYINFDTYHPNEAVIEESNLASFGFKEGVQNLNLTSFAEGAPGHTAHLLAQLLRILGVPMTSNRPDRDNYISVNWKYVQKGKEHLLEKDPLGAWFRDLPYDFRSATHAPANFLCDEQCRRGAQTVQPLQDHLWQRTLSMGHSAELSDTDVQLVRRLYEKECAKRYGVESK